MVDSHVPVLVGAAQFTQRKNETVFLDPMGLMVKTALMAINDTKKPGIKDAVDTVYVVNVQTLTYEDAPGMLAGRLGMTPKIFFYSGLGGNTPQKLLNKAAKAIAAGESRAVLISGGEAMYSLRRAIRGEISLDWPTSQPPKTIDELEKKSVNDMEAAFGLELPVYMYPLFETALRGASGRNLESHRRYMGRICRHLSRVASENPHSWNQTPRSADELTLPSPENRYIAYPYTKQMVANMYVDQGASLIMTSAAVAQELGIDPALWVYPMGGADLCDIWNVSQRPKIHEAPALGMAARSALDQAGIGLSDIRVFDFYSCFPCAVEMGRRSVGLDENDPRDLSVTGGLSYFGGPMNNYSLHSVASMVDWIRSNPSGYGLVTSVGWYMTKHAVMVYGKRPGKISWREKTADNGLQKEVDDRALPGPVEKAEGPLTVEAYTVIHGRKGDPKRGIVIGRMKDGQRAIAEIDGDGEILLRCEETELVGQTGAVRYDTGSNKNRVKFENL